MQGIFPRGHSREGCVEAAPCSSSTIQSRPLPSLSIFHYPLIVSCSHLANFIFTLSSSSLCLFLLPQSITMTMSGCGKPDCKCGDDCQCSANCSCCRTLAAPAFGGLRNYNAENDCKCGPNCNCATCDCHK